MAYYKIAGLNVEFNFSNFDFSNPYLEEYKVESFDKADITVKFELNNNINENLPTPFVSKGGRNYFETEDLLSTALDISVFAESICSKLFKVFVTACVILD